MDIAEFDKARLDEDEAAAKGASWDRPGDRWHVWGERSDGAWVVDDDGEEGFVIPRIGGGADTEGVARHVARNDPARALREVAAKRAILDEYERDPQADDQYRAGLAFALERLAEVYES